MDYKFNDKSFISKSIRFLGKPCITDWSKNIKGPSNLIDLSIGQPDYDVPIIAKTNLIKAMYNGKNGYQDSQGVFELRKKIMIKRFETQKNEDIDIAITAGSTAGLYTVFNTCFDEGDHIIVFDPYFPQYIELIQLFKLKPIVVDTYPTFNINIELLEHHITSKTKAILLNSPNNPTGVVIDISSIELIVKYANEHDILIIIDEIYKDLVYKSSNSFDPFKYGYNTVIVGGLSKSYGMTGWRIGYVIAHKDLIYYVTELQAQIYQCVTSIVQYAAISVLDKNLSKLNTIYKKRSDYIKTRLSSKYEISESNGGYFFFIKVPEEHRKSALEFCADLKKKGLLTVPGCIFSQRDTHFRISICKKMSQIKKAVKILNKMVE